MAHDNTNDYPVRIMEDGTGKYNQGSGLKGYIDDVRIWKRTITDKEVKALYTPVTTTAARTIDLNSSKTVIYPNPANGKVNISFNVNQKAETRIMIYNLNGAVVKGFTYPSSVGQNQTSFNVNGWAPGIYLVRLLTGSTSETTRLVVTK